MKNKTDIKELNIPNVCFSLSRVDSKHEKDYKQQRIERGFDDSETWSLTDTVAAFIIPRLERYLEIVKEKGFKSPEHIGDATNALKALKLLVRDDGTQNFTPLESAEVTKGLDKLSDIFLDLWW